MILHVLWRYPPTRPGLFDVAYRGFNLLEAAIWFLCAVWVAGRWRRHRRSQLEPAYAMAFLLFGFTDVREAYQLDVPLLAAKLIVLLALARFRKMVRPLYPGSRML